MRFIAIVIGAFVVVVAENGSPRAQTVAIALVVCCTRETIVASCPQDRIARNACTSRTSECHTLSLGKSKTVCSGGAHRSTIFVNLAIAVIVDTVSADFRYRKNFANTRAHGN